MPASVTHCEHCQAQVTNIHAYYCAFCGTAVPQADPPASVVQEDEARFAALDAAANLETLMGHTPGFILPGTLASRVFGGVFLVVFVGFALTISGGILASGAPKIMVLAPITIVGLAVFTMGRGASRGLKNLKAPLERRKAMIRDERVSMDGHSDRPTRTQHFTLLEYPDGSREEFRVDARTAGQMAPGDMGIAYIRGTALIDFKRVRV